ncbi:MAG: carbohydrate ABC transporter permease, partial [Bacilli bacterium]
MKKRFRTMNKVQKVILWIVFGVFSIYALSLLFPFVWMLINSFKTNADFFADIWSFPLHFTLENYGRALTQFTVGRFNLLTMFLISIGITLAATVINTLLSSMAAYVVAKYENWFTKALYSVAIFTIIMPLVGTLPAQYRLMQSLHLVNTVYGLLILYSGSFGFTFFIMHGFFKSLSWTYAEAAFVDGANDFQVFFRVMFPMAMPVTISMSIIYAIGIWNDYVTPSIYLKQIPTLAV